jgi:hypothetical protein
MLFSLLYRAFCQGDVNFRFFNNIVRVIFTIKIV